MRRILVCSLLSFTMLAAWGQKEPEHFKGYFYNNEYNVYLKINFHECNIVVPNHDLFGNLPGYLGKKNNSFYWLITSCKVQNNKEADIELINDYGSEDLTATFTKENDSIFVLRQKDGSTLKVPNKGKWQKLPKRLEFIKK